jgi:hypothetical protein
LGASGLLNLEWVSLLKDTTESKIYLKVSRELQHTLYQCDEITIMRIGFVARVATSTVRIEKEQFSYNASQFSAKPCVTSLTILCQADAFKSSNNFGFCISFLTDNENSFRLKTFNIKRTLW